MEKGLIFALIASVCYAVSVIFIRRAVSRSGESFTSALILTFIGVPFFITVVSFNGDWGKFWVLSWQGFALLGAAGIVHFVAGRLLNYNAFRLIGANKANAYIRTSIFYTVAFGAIFLSETITTSLVLGVLCIFAGAALVSWERKSIGEEKQRLFRGTEIKGILAALGGALCWGTSPILIRSVVNEIGSPSAAALISYTTASIVLACFLLRQQQMKQLVQLRSRVLLIPLLIAGIFLSAAQLLNYTALSYSPASMVTPLLSTSYFLIFFFSFILNRNMEVFSLKVILGMSATVAGTFLIFY